MSSMVPSGVTANSRHGLERISLSSQLYCIGIGGRRYGISKILNRLLKIVRIFALGLHH